MERRLLDDPRAFPEAAAWVSGVDRRGEPWTFGFDPAALPGYLRPRGMALESDRSTAEAASLHGGPPGASALHRVATAEVR